MIARIIDASLRHRVLVLIGALLLAAGGVWSVRHVSLDALPDLSDTQVIVYAEYPGQSPRAVEDQVTYPLASALLSVPGSRTVRSYSFFGYALIYVLFDDETDLYWARTRVLESLSASRQRLPEGVVPVLGPDASGVGWVYQYALISDRHSLQELRSLQDWFLKYELSGVDGVSEVASVGGFVKQYQIAVHPGRLRDYGVRLDQIEVAVQRAYGDEGGEALEMAEAEHMIRMRGGFRDIDEIGKIPLFLSGFGSSRDARSVDGMQDMVGASRDFLGVVRLRDVADIEAVPAMRRGIAELDGNGEVVGGIVIMRSGANALDVIRAVKSRLAALEKNLPEGIRVIPVYDRSSLILNAVHTLRDKLIEEILAVALVCWIFLGHVRSALVAVAVLPLSLLMAFMWMRWQGISANIMSLGGIAIAIGAMVDAAIVMIENAHKHLEQEQQKPAGERRVHGELIALAAKEVGPSLFFALLIMTISFLPVFTLEHQEGRLFAPLAFTKTYAMAAASLLAITLVPVLMVLWIRGPVMPELNNPLNRWMESLYHPVMHWTLRHPFKVLACALSILLLTIIPFSRLGNEFMPPLDEGNLLYMPTTLPGVSVTKARELLQQTDRLIRTVPEVQRVFGKAGRAETPTDPAGLEMLETIIQLKPRGEWRPGVTLDSLINELNARVQVPGLTNSWTMPIKTRVDMLSTGIRTPVGIKISGPDLDSLQKIAFAVEKILRHMPETRSVFAERVAWGNYLEIRAKREELARYGLDVESVRAAVRMALAGMPVITVAEGRERYAVIMRYAREWRDSPERVRRILLDLPAGGHIPLERVAEVVLESGPMMIRGEDARPNSWVLIEPRGGDLGGYVRAAQRALDSTLTLPTGYSLAWSGEFEAMERLRERLLWVIPLTLFLVAVLLYVSTGSWIRTGIVLLAVPFSLVGAVWMLYILDYQLSAAVWVGMIALAGLDAETGAVMLLYLEKAYERSHSGLRDLEDLKRVIDQGAVRRVRPKIMTAAVILAGLAPLLWSSGAGADVMKRIAAPMVGGVVSSVCMELMVYPVIFYLWKKKEMRANS